ncbi:MAG: LON peptidase substrate-binding domain-containing protein [Anaerolineae bacterium]|nr:LON peptidase substrate-binding domain-containing protein [Anaerolineae bacterium]
MNEIPLFPLNTVLFPGTPLPLRIFEPRYLSMVSSCIEKKMPFGVVLIKRGQEAFGPLAETFNIGTLARIVKIEQLENNQLNIIVIGEERFEITALDREHEYLIAKVIDAGLPVNNMPAIKKEGRSLRPLVRSYLDLLMQINEMPANPYQLPRDPLQLAYTAAYMLQIPPRQKQGLLEAQEGEEMIRDLRRYYRQEIALVKEMADHPADFTGKQNGLLN